MLKVTIMIVIALFQLGCVSLKTEPKPTKVLIVDGQNNHQVWPKSTRIIADWLKATGQFTVDIQRTKFVWNSRRFGDQFSLKNGGPYIEGAPKTDPDFSPNFSDYDVVISNFGWRAAPWPTKTKAAFERYMKDGGGFVVMHAADNAFPNWPAYNKMIGLGGWGNRNEKAGPYVYFDHFDQQQYDFKKGPAGGHGKQHAFEVKIRDIEHPIAAGLPLVWRHTKDELYHHLRGPAQNMTIIATAYSDPELGGSGRHEPVLMSINYHKGRVFHTTLGHDLPAFKGLGFKTSLIQGVTWAAGR